MYLVLIITVNYTHVVLKILLIFKICDRHLVLKCNIRKEVFHFHVSELLTSKSLWNITQMRNAMVNSFDMTPTLYKPL
jgi:hypothetical protein